MGHLSDDLADFCAAHVAVDGLGEPELRETLAPMLRRCVTVAEALLRMARVALEGDVPASAVIGPLTRLNDALGLHDLAFVLRIDLLKVQHSALHLAPRHCGRRILLSQMQHLVDELGRLRSLLSGSQVPGERLKGVEASVSSRLAYASLRSGSIEFGELEHEENAVRRALLHAGALIGALVTSQGYAYFRASDRGRVVGLQRRILDYFQHDESVPTGVQVVRDLKAFVGFMSVINQRQDVKRHDRQVMARWVLELEGNANATRDLLGSLRQYRNSLYGCDPELDATFDGNVTVSRRGLLNLLRRLVLSLGEGTSPGDGGRAVAAPRSRAH